MFDIYIYISKLRLLEIIQGCKIFEENGEKRSQNKMSQGLVEEIMSGSENRLEHLQIENDMTNE